MDSLNTVLKKIKKLVDSIRDIEGNAEHELYVECNAEKYRRYMLDKTLLLFHFPEKIEEELTRVNVDLRKFIRHQTGGFSHGAEKALAINSSFYMSALLYPENYQEGNDNDLEAFLELLKTKVEERPGE